MKLIDADALKALFDEQYDTAFMQMHTRDNIEHWNGVCAGVNWGRNTIADSPTVDAVPVKHGHWEQCGVYDRCSVCCRYTIMFPLPGLPHFKYCPYCGARLGGERRCDNGTK